MLKRSLVVVLAALAVARCMKEEDESSASPETPKVTSVFAPETFVKGPTDVDIGDVEAMVHFNTTLAPESASDSIQVTELRDAVDRVKLLTLNVSPPYPEHLWLLVSFHARRAFELTPVVLRTTVYADQRELGSFMLVAGKHAEGLEHQEKFDVLQGLESIPETMLVKVVTEALLMPPHTDEATLDPKTATTTPDRITTSVPCGPARINFKPADASP